MSDDNAAAAAAGANGAAGGGDNGAAAAAAAAANGASANGSGGVEWLPGIDPDSANFVTGLGYKDLPSFVKGAIETKRAFSAGRPFEVPKAEDADSWKKINAALGVPETPDKYDFGEAAKTMKPEELKAWAGDLHKLGIPNKAAAGLVAVATQKAAAFKQAEETRVAAQITESFEKLNAEWGDNAKANLDLANRGWVAAAKEVGWSKEMMEAVERVPGGTRALHTMGLLLGRHMVEAGFVVSDGQHRGMTKEGAQKRLNEMGGDKTIGKALVDRAHPEHQRYLAEKRELEAIAFG